jgi:hypothetical protein
MLPTRSPASNPKIFRMSCRTPRRNGALGEEAQPGANPMPDNDANLMTIFAEALERTDPSARSAYLDEG